MKLLFIDSETNGLPKNKYAPYSQTEMWCHVIQISWAVVDSASWSIIKEEDHFLKVREPWSSEAERIHQIPESIVRKFGKDPVQVLQILQSDIDKCDAVIAHNMTFDKTVIMAEVQRLYDTGIMSCSPSQFWSCKKDICTMKATKKYVGLTFKNSTDLKFPKLSELYAKLFGVVYDVSGAPLHNARHDVNCLVTCVQKLLTLPEFADLLV